MGRRRKQKNPLDYISIPRLSLSADIKQSIWAVFFLTLGIICFLSIFGLAGSLGAYLSKAMDWLSGWGNWLIPVLLLVTGWELYQTRGSRSGGLRYFGIFLFLWSFQGMLQLFVDVENWNQALELGKGGGHIGWSLAVIVIKLFGFWAGIVVVLGLLIIGLMLMFNTNLATLFRSGAMPARLLARPFSSIFSGKKDSALAREYDEKAEQGEALSSGATVEGEIDDSFNLRSIKDDSRQLKNVGRAIGEDDKMSWKPTNIKIDIPFDLLNSRPSKPTSGDIKSNIEIIKTTLEKFNIPVEMGDVSVGPTVTQYTLKPAEGIKLSRITGLNNDLSMALAAHPVRIEAPIPGKALVGIEVPNRTVAIVNLREVLESEDFKRRNNNLMIALGKDVAGKVWLDSINKMPHLLVAGATGSGKSVMLNTLIVSLLYQNNPDDLKFIMVDPKRVELTVYNGLPHLLTPVITEVSKTINALKWCLNEMDRRFETLSQVHKRDIEGYNQSNKEKMPYIIFIIDELADLMVVAPKEMEAGIVRLAQMARAVGIHLILATQRPSVNVITGTIKANMPARIAFSVTSGIDSRTILDSLGAEKLLGRGDMLFSSVALTKPKRIQGALITDQEIKRVVSYIKEKSGSPNYITEIVERQKVRGVAGVGIDGGTDDDDELFQEAKELIINSGKASASFLQRRLSIGYARAARLLDILEESGIIGPSNGAKAREIMVTKEQYEAMIQDGVAGVRLHNQATAEAPDNYLGDDDTLLSEESDDEIEEENDEEKNDNSDDNDQQNDSNNESEVPEFMTEEVDENGLDDEEVVPTSSPKEKKSEKSLSNKETESEFERYFSR
jgi:S-DNA-T family DNA segregation ATPase FtsK/SpoIIIE